MEHPKESKIVEKINEGEVSKICSKSFKTKCGFFNHLFGLINGNNSPEERLRYKINRYAHKIGADKVTLEMCASTIYYLPINSAKESGWGESFYLANANFYKEN